MLHFGRAVWLALCLLAAAAAAPAAADTPVGADPERLAAAKELMVAAGSARQFDAVIPLLSQQMEQAFIRLKPEHEDIIHSVFKLIPERFAERKQELLDQIAVLYAERFTTEELHGARDFFASPLGRKFVSAQSDLVQQRMVLG